MQPPHEWLPTAAVCFPLLPCLLRIVDGGEIGVFGPAAVGWYKVLERYVVLKNRNAQMLARVALDQLGFAPVGIAAFFSAMSVMEGGSPSQKLGESWWTALRANWNVWPAAQLVNFRFVPLDLRIVFVNVVSLGGLPLRPPPPSSGLLLTGNPGWNSYLSWLNTQKHNSEHRVVLAAVQKLEKA